MNDFVTEEQQVEALKQWWSENGYYLIGGVVLGLGILFGWDYYKGQKAEHATEGAALMFELDQALEKGNSDSASEALGKLQGDFGNTPYAAMANLQLAANLVKANQLDDAIGKLDWVIANSDKAELVEIATLRKARVLVSLQKFDEALSLLSDALPAAYAGMVEELRGDAYQGKGELDKARTAYDRALLASGGGSEYLQLKRDALGEAGGDAS